MGEIPGAYTQALSFDDIMDDDDDSDEEVETLWQGIVAMKFDRDFKQRIRRPWVRKLIVKVYGRAAGLNFLQAKLVSVEASRVVGLCRFRAWVFHYEAVHERKFCECLEKRSMVQLETTFYHLDHGSHISSLVWPMYPSLQFGLG